MHQPQKSLSAKRNGNALFLILIAIALFAALSYAVTNSSRGQGDINREIRKIDRSEFDNYSANINLAVSRLSFDGCQKYNYTPPHLQGAEDKSCHVFHPDGGGAYWRDFGNICPDSRILKSLAIGESCGLMVYAGNFNGERIYTTPADQGAFSWNNGTSSWTITGATSASDGETNTNTLVTSADGGAPYNAANSCRALGTDWYLPSQAEIDVLYTNRIEIGGFSSSIRYWSSREHNSNQAWNISFSNGVWLQFSRTNSYRVRCIRKE